MKNGYMEAEDQLFSISTQLPSGNGFEQQHERLRLYMEEFPDSESS